MCFALLMITASVKFIKKQVADDGDAGSDQRKDRDYTESHADSGARWIAAGLAVPRARVERGHLGPDCRLPHHEAQLGAIIGLNKSIEFRFYTVERPRTETKAGLTSDQGSSRASDPKWAFSFARFDSKTEVTLLISQKEYNYAI
jgi:hypothetical protein